MKRSLLAVAVMLLGIFFIIKFAFVIKNINIEDSDACLGQESVKNQFLGKNTLLFSTEKAQALLKQENSCLEDVAIRRNLPQTLTIVAKSKVPAAKIDGTDLLATSDGLIIKKQVTTNTPTIYLQNKSNLQENKKIEDRTALFALEVASGLLKSDFTPASVRLLDSQTVAVYSTSGIIALFTTQTSASAQVDSLQQIMTKAKIDATKIEKIDLRFDKPTIVLK